MTNGIIRGMVAGVLGIICFVMASQIIDGITQPEAVPVPVEERIPAAIEGKVWAAGVPIPVETSEEAAPREIGGAESAVLGAVPVVLTIAVTTGVFIALGFHGTTSRREERVFVLDPLMERSQQMDMTFRELLGSLHVVASWQSLIPFLEPLRVSSSGTFSFWPRWLWLVLDKHPRYPMYLVAGAPKSGYGFSVYLLGRDSGTGTLYCMRVPPEFAEQTAEEAADWCIGVNDGDTVHEV